MQLSLTADDLFGVLAQSPAVAVTAEATGIANCSQRVLAPYIGMSMAQDQDLTAVVAVSG